MFPPQLGPSVNQESWQTAKTGYSRESLLLEEADDNNLGLEETDLFTLDAHDTFDTYKTTPYGVDAARLANLPMSKSVADDLNLKVKVENSRRAKANFKARNSRGSWLSACFPSRQTKLRTLYSRETKENSGRSNSNSLKNSAQVSTSDL